MLGMFSVALPVLLRVRLWGALVELICSKPNAKLVGERFTVGPVPVPVRLIVWGLPEAVSVIVIAPVHAPAPVGVKVTLIEQFDPAARVAPHVVVSTKSPLDTMLEIFSVPVPVLLRVTLWGALVVLIAWLANVRLVGDRLTDGGAPEVVKDQ